MKKSFCLFTVLFAGASFLMAEPPKELSELEFGFEVESYGTDKPLLELRDKYRDQLLLLGKKLKSRNDATATQAVVNELEALDAPPSEELATDFEELRRLQEAYRNHYKRLSSLRKIALEKLIRHYQEEATKLADEWKKAGRIDDATLALESSGKFSVHVDRPIKYVEGTSKETEPGKEGGKLHAWGVTAGRIPIDISATSRFNDFVSVEYHDRYWAAVRADGSVVSNHPELGKLQDVSRIVMGGGLRYYALSRSGEVTCVRPDPLMPSNLKGVHKLVASYQDALALSDGGRVVGWGENFSKADKRIPQTLNDIVDIALTWGSEHVQGFALRSDGRVSTWGGGEKKVTIPTDLPKIVEIDAGWTVLLCRTEEGKVIPLSQNGNPGTTTPPPTLPPVVDLHLRGPIAAGKTEDGNWVAWGSQQMGIVEQINRIGTAKNLTYKANASPEGWGAVLWIE